MEITISNANIEKVADVLVLIPSLCILSVIGGVGFLISETPVPFLSRAVIAIGLASALAWWVALLFDGYWYEIVTLSFFCLGAVGWSRCTASRAKFNAHSVMLLLVFACAALLPIATSFGILDQPDIFTSAQNRFLSLPVDNRIPWMLADAARGDSYPTPLIGDWLGSDRPPLQSGLLILGAPLMRAFSQGMRADFVLSYVAQLVWIVGAFEVAKALSRNGLRLSPTAGVATASLTGMVVVNTLFTWPKLLSAGLLLATFASALRWSNDPNESSIDRRHHHLIAASILGSLAALSHGGALFALIPLALWIMAKILVAPNRHPYIHGSAFVFPGVVLYLPWVLWQKLGDPPGNRLLKWHIGGDLSIDQRGVLKTVWDSYSRHSFGDVLYLKWTNLENLFRNVHHPGRRLSPYQTLRNPAAVVETDFFGVMAVISWALPIVVLGLLACFLKSRRSKIVAAFKASAPAWYWWLASLGCWILLMFGPSATINHHGPLTMALLPLILFGAMFATVSRTMWFIGTSLQGLAWLMVYPLYRTTWKDGSGPYLLSLAIVVLLIALVMCTEWLEERSHRVETRST